MMIQDIEDNWGSLNDFIYCSVFGAESTVNETNRKIAINKQVIEGKRVFIPNEFPYQISGGYHYVLWYAHNQHAPITDSLIDEHIRMEIKLILKCIDNHCETTFDYCWYENPKQSVPGVYHLQVFWITL